MRSLRQRPIPSCRAGEPHHPGGKPRETLLTIEPADRNLYSLVQFQFL